MAKYKIWNKIDDLVTVTGKIKTSDEIFLEYPLSAVDGIKYIIIDDIMSLGIFLEMNQGRNHFKNMIISLATTSDTTDEELEELQTEYENATDDEFLDMLSYFDEHQQDVTELSDTARLAAAIEMQNLLLMSDEEEVI